MVERICVSHNHEDHEDYIHGLNVVILPVYISEIDGARWVVCIKCTFARRLMSWESDKHNAHEYNGKKLAEVIDHLKTHVEPKVVDLVEIGTHTQEQSTATAALIGKENVDGIDGIQEASTSDDSEVEGIDQGHRDAA